MATRIAQTDLARDALYTKVNQMYDEKVSLTGNETIGGVKSFTSDMYIYNNNPFLYLKQPSLIKGDTPSSNITASVSFVDDTGTLSGAHQFSSIGCQVSAETGLVTCFMNAYKNVEDSTDNARIAVYYPIDGNPYTYAPTPTDTTSTSSHQIATVGWANSTNNNIVHKTGDETISGAKTFQGTGWITYIKNTSVTYNTAPSSDTTTAIAFVDKNSYNMGVVECIRYPHNSTITQLNAYGPNGAWASTPLALEVMSDGTSVAHAPTPGVSSNSTHIVTTAYINNKFKVVSSLPSSPNSNVFYFVTG